MLGKFITVNGEAFPNPNPGTFSDNFEAIENSFMTEAGTSLTNIVRLDRYSWAAEFNCTSRMRERIAQLVKTPEVTCTIAGQEYTGRIRLDGAITLVANSEKIPGTDGLWVIKLKFEQN